MGLSLSYALFLSIILILSGMAQAAISRKQVVQAFNVRRTKSSSTTPLQVGNGNFAFGVDVTGLQTFSPFNTLSTWGWHNFSLPTTPGQTSVEDFKGVNWTTHGRPVNYAQPNPAQNDLSSWLIQNPQRLNLGRIGLDFGNNSVSESQLVNTTQTLDLWTGGIHSTFLYKGKQVDVQTYCHPDSDVLSIRVESDLLESGDLGVFFDFPYPDRNKFDAPYVGVWNRTADHILNASSNPYWSQMSHTLDGTTYMIDSQWEGTANVIPPSAPGSKRHVIQSSGRELFMSVGFSDTESLGYITPADVVVASEEAWPDFWNSGGFIDLTAVKSPNATELQRRIILSQYLTMVNSASTNPPQESGLVNNGWYGKFHMEMCFWHSAHFARWNRFPLLWRSMPNTYSRFLQSSIERAKAQGYKGARWPKMTDPTGRSAPGEINSLLIWQQPHPMYFAEMEYRSFPNASTLKSWDGILTATADFMASFAFLNNATGFYDLGPPMYPVSENTNPNATVNPTFELAYWRFGLDVAIKWKQRLKETVPPAWLTVRDKLAPLPVVDDTFPIYEGIPLMWTNSQNTFDHPAMVGVYGWLPPPSSGAPLNMTVVRNTAARVRRTWALDQSYGWDFSMLAMNSLRLGDVDQALEYLLHPAFQFDDAGYPVGGSRVPTPYFPNSASLLLVMAMMAGGWDGAEGPHFPSGWDVKVEGFTPGM